jgi:hypothetical protein
VLRVSADGKPTSLLKLPKGVADHEYVVDRRLLVIPLVLDHTLRAYRWSPER